MSEKLPSQEEIDAFEAGLNETDRLELKRQQMVHALVTREPPKEIDWATATDAQIQAEILKGDRRKLKGGD